MSHLPPCSPSPRDRTQTKTKDISEIISKTKDHISTTMQNWKQVATLFEIKTQSQAVNINISETKHEKLS